MVTRRFLALAGAAVAVGAVLVAVALCRRSDGGWLRAPCGEIRWMRDALPVPVFLDPAAERWTADVQAALVLIDPPGHWLTLAGPLPPHVAQPASAIRLDLDAPVPIDGPAHGNTAHDVKWLEDDGCWLKAVRVSLPPSLGRGPVRVRAIAHELGHALGLAHSDDETSLMYPKATPMFEFRLSEADRARLVSAYGR